MPVPPVCRLLRFPLVAPSGAGGQVVVAAGGGYARANSAVQASCQGHRWGRCRCSRRAEDATRAGMLIRVRRIVGVVARVRSPPALVAAARVRLNASTAQTSHALLAENDPEGMCARAELFRSALTFSMIACPRWVLSATVVSAVSAGVVVKKAWNRHAWNRLACPGAAFGSRSGIRRTTRRPVTRSDFFFDANAM